MEFEWNEAKAELNARKHDVPFPFATRVFFDVNRLEWADTGSRQGEHRWVTIGLIDGVEIILAYYDARRGYPTNFGEKGRTT